MLPKVIVFLFFSYFPHLILALDHKLEKNTNSMQPKIVFLSPFNRNKLNI